MKWLKHPIIFAILIGCFISSSVIGLRIMGALQPLELALYDFFLQQRPIQAIDDRIVIIGFTDEDFDGNDDHSGYGYPIADGTLAKLLASLTQAGASTIGVDIYRPYPVIGTQPQGPQQLQTILQDNQTIVWIKKFGSAQERSINPPQALHQSPMQIGFNDLIPDSDGIVRRALLTLSNEQQSLFSFAMMLTLHYLANHNQPIPQPNADGDMLFGDQLIPPLNANFGSYINIDTAGYQYLLSYPGMPQAFTRYSLHQILSGQIKPQQLADKIILIGTTARSVQDYFYTPYTAAIYGHEQERLAGVALHAYAVSQLLQLANNKTQVTTSLTNIQEYILIILCALLSSLLAHICITMRQFFALISIGFILIASLCYSLFLQHWWLPLAPLALSWVVAAAMVTALHAFQAKAQHTELMQIFSRHVSPDVAHMLWQQRDQLLEKNGRVKPQRIQATVLFSDLKGFTSISENMDPAALMEWLNHYMDSMTQVVMAHGGVIDKFIGDAIMAVFGVPVPQHHTDAVAIDARKAVECSLAMEQALFSLNQEWKQQGLPTVGMRIGIYTGYLVAGSVGSEQRSDYTVLGDTVNTASRLESFDKSIGIPDRDCRILIGEATLQHLNDGYDIEPVGAIKLKGKRHPVQVYMILGNSQQNTDPHHKIDV